MKPGPKPSGNAKQHLTLRLPKELLEKLRNLAQVYQTNVSQLVEKLIKLGLDKLE